MDDSFAQSSKKGIIEILDEKQKSNAAKIEEQRGTTNFFPRQIMTGFQKDAWFFLKNEMVKINHS